MVRAPPSGSDGKRQLSYDVRIWKTRPVKGAKGRTYQVRWTVAGKVRYATFANKGLAGSHEAKLKTAAREGEAFDVAAGLPLSVLGDDQGHERVVSWYEFACAYVDMKWAEVSPNSRRSIADALATATTALVTTKRGAPKPAEMRKALYGWAFNTKRREAGPPPNPAAAITWIERRPSPCRTWATQTLSAGSCTNSPASKTAPLPRLLSWPASVPCCSICSATPWTKSTSR